MFICKWCDRQWEALPDNTKLVPETQSRSGYRLLIIDGLAHDIRETRDIPVEQIDAAA